ncbi:transposase [Pseudomonas sp. S32]|nr:transposase [Pseudomonas sp. S32]
MSDTKQPAESCSAEAKMAAIMETAALSELEIGEYCRRKGIFPEQITDWRNAFIASSTKQSTAKNVSAGQSRADKNRIRELERELRRKDAALAEAAALLVLRKKLNAYWDTILERSEQLRLRPEEQSALKSKSPRMMPWQNMAASL